MTKTATRSGRRIFIAAFASIAIYAVLGTIVDNSLVECRADTKNDCSLLLGFSAAVAVGLPASVALFGVVLMKYDRSSQKPLESAFYNTNASTLTLVFGKPITLSNRWILRLANGRRAYLEISIGHNIGRGRMSTVRGEPNRCHVLSL